MHPYGYGPTFGLYLILFAPYGPACLAPPPFRLFQEHRMCNPPSGIRWFRLAISSCLFGTMCLVNTGCSTFAAVRAPIKKDLSVLRLGTPKSLVDGELGPPLQSRQEADGTHHDVYSFKQGYAKSTLVTRSALHAILDVQTLFLWELIAMPLESSLQGENVKAEVAYDERGHVRRIEYFSGAYLTDGGAVWPKWMRRKKLTQTAVFESSNRSAASAESSPKPSSTDVVPASAEGSPTPQVSAKDSQDSKMVPAMEPKNAALDRSAASAESKPKPSSTDVVPASAESLQTPKVTLMDSQDSKMVSAMELRVDALEKPIYFDDRRENPADSVGLDERFTLSAFSGTMSGFRTEFKLANNASVGTNIGFKLGNRTVGNAGDLDLLWYPNENTGEFRPYLLAGAGYYEKFGLENITVVSGLSLPIGGGVKWTFNDWGALRIDLRDYLVFGNAISKNGLWNLEATGGVEVRF